MGEFLLVVLGLILFQLLIIFHEYGHFLVAKRNGVKVKEFGLGFPPKIWGKTMGWGIFRSYYSLNLLPIGGFVRLEGENDEAQAEGTYGSKSLYVKTKIILAGVVVNFLIAIGLFTLLALIGIPKLLPAGPFEEDQFSLASDTQIVETRTFVAAVYPDTPAEVIGLEVGDQLILLTSATGKIFEINNSQALINQTTQLAGQAVDLQIRRDGGLENLSLTLRSLEAAEADQQGRLGIATSDFVIQRNTWSAPLTGIVLSAQYTKVTLQGLWYTVSSLLQGDTQTAKDSVAGPIGIFFVLRAGAENGVQLLLMIIALLSLTLAIMNTLPIPALDGGRLALTVFFRKILRRPLLKKIETRIVGISMIFLLLLIVIITISDIERFLL